MRTRRDAAHGVHSKIKAPKYDAGKYIMYFCSEYGHLIVSHDGMLHFGSRDNKCADCVFEYHICLIMVAEL